MNKRVWLLSFILSFLMVFSLSQSLVELSKRNKEAEKKSKPTKVITNADLKKIKGGKLAIEKGVKPITEEKKSETEGLTPEEKAAFNKIYQLAGTLYGHQAEKKIKDLQLKKLRKEYFASDNGVYRDNVIKPEMQKVYQDMKMLDLKIMEDKDALERAKKEELDKGIDLYVLNMAERKAKEEVEKRYKKEREKYIPTEKKSRFSTGNIGSSNLNVDKRLNSRFSVFDKLGKEKVSGRLTPAERLKLKEGQKKEQ